MPCAPTGSGPVGSINRCVHVTTGTKRAVVVGTNRAAADVRSRTANRARRRWIQTRLDAVWARFIQAEDVADEVRGWSAVRWSLAVVVCMPWSRQSVRSNGKERRQRGDRLTAPVNYDVESLHREWWLQLTVERLNASVIGRLAAKCCCCCCLLLLTATIIAAPQRNHHFSTSCTALLQCYFRHFYRDKRRSDRTRTIR